MNNKACYLYIFFIFMLGNAAKAQSVSVGIRGGISIPNLRAGGSDNNPLTTGYSSRLGPDAAVFAAFKLSDMVSIQPMLEYSAQGAKKNGFQALPAPAAAAILFPPGELPPFLYANFNNEIKLNYLMLPILAKFGFNLNGSAWRLYADAGPFAGLLLSAKNVTGGASDIYKDAAGQQSLGLGSLSFNNHQDVKDSLQRWNAGVEANIGLQYDFGRSSLFMEGGGNYGLINLQKNEANGKNKTGAVTVSLGYSFRLGE